MVEPNRGNGRDDRMHHVGRVESSAEPDFDHRDVHRRAPEQLEPDRGGDLEEGGVRVEDAVRAQGLDDVANVCHRGDECAPIDRAAADDEALLEADQMR